MRRLVLLVFLLPLACQKDTWVCRFATVERSILPDGGNLASTEPDGGWSTCVPMCGDGVISCSPIHPCAADGGDCVTCTMNGFDRCE